MHPYQRRRPFSQGICRVPIGLLPKMFPSIIIPRVLLPSHDMSHIRVFSVLGVLFVSAFYSGFLSLLFLSSGYLQYSPVNVHFEGLDNFFSFWVESPSLTAVQQNRKHIASDHGHFQFYTKVLLTFRAQIFKRRYLLDCTFINWRGALFAF